MRFPFLKNLSQWLSGPGDRDSKVKWLLIPHMAMLLNRDSESKTFMLRQSSTNYFQENWSIVLKVNFSRPWYLSPLFVLMINVIYWSYLVTHRRTCLRRWPTDSAVVRQQCVCCIYCPCTWLQVSTVWVRVLFWSQMASEMHTWIELCNAVS